MKSKDVPVEDSIRGRRIRELRMAAGLRQVHVCSKAGLKPALYSKLESGIIGLTADYIEILRPVFGCSYRAFFVKPAAQATAPPAA